MREIKRSEVESVSVIWTFLLNVKDRHLIFVLPVSSVCNLLRWIIEEKRGRRFFRHPFLFFPHLLADLLVALRGDEHLDTGLVHIVDVWPMSLDLGVFYAAGQAVDGPCCPGDGKSNYYYCWVMEQVANMMPSASSTRLHRLNIA